MNNYRVDHICTQMTAASNLSLVYTADLKVDIESLGIRITFTSLKRRVK